MKLILATLAGLALLTSGCVLRPAGEVTVGGTVGVYGEYPETYSSGPVYVYPHRYHYYRHYYHPYDRDHYFYRPYRSWY